MIARRIFSALFDLIITFLPVYFVNMFGVNYSIQNVLYLWIAMYFIAISILLLIAGRTYGDAIFKIKITTVKGKINKSSLILRNFIYCFFIFLIILGLDSFINFFISLILLISLNIFIFAKNKFDKPMTAIDLLFKTFYVKNAGIY